MLTRRDFLKTAIIGGTGLATMGLVGCSSSSSSETTNNTSSATSETEADSSQSEGITFPLEETVTMTMWAPFNVNASSVMEDYNGSLVFQEMEKITNVHIDFIHPAIGQESEQFNLMIASQEYPDMIMSGITRYNGGGDLAVEEGVFLQLNDLIAENAPNYTALLEANSEAKRQASSDSGIMSAMLPIMRQENLCWYGPVIRKDWLEETGLDIPETVEDWEILLTAMKENHPDATPLLFTTSANTFKARGYDVWGMFMSAYGLGSGATYGTMYNDNGTVKYSPIEDSFKPEFPGINCNYS